MNTMTINQACHQLLQLWQQDIAKPEAYRTIIEVWQQILGSDACVLQQWQHETSSFIPLAAIGVVQGFSGRTFSLDDHPRLQRIFQKNTWVRFAADSPLPDPYDGLIQGEYPHLPVHDCMGLTLVCNHQKWGMLTLDALNPHAFDTISTNDLETLKLATESVLSLFMLSECCEQEPVLKSSQKAASTQYEILGSSAGVQQLRNEIALVAPTHFSTLILGESGVGKELVAHALHQQSHRSKSSFVTVNCAALPDSLLESELFGHVKGAFSGADKDRLGKFEIAQGGTLFLDEVGELSLTAQAKLLRVLQNGDIQRLGSDRHHQVDVRVIAATNRDLLVWVEEGKFRADLYHRLSVYPITIPPLRERGYDILLLAAHFLSRLQKQFNLSNLCLTHEAENELLQASWSGNVRELEHCLSRAVLKLLQRNPKPSERILLLQATDLDITQSDVMSRNEIGSSFSQTTHELTLKIATDQFQQHYIQQALVKSDGNKSQAAKKLGLDRSNFQRLSKRLGLF